MAQNQSTPALTTTTTIPGAELLQAQAELWCHMFGFLKPMALQCAIKLGIPNTISRHGGAASLSELCAALPVAPSKRTCLSRLMKLLATMGIFREEKETTPPGGEGEEGSYLYHLTAVSRLLVDDDDGGHPCLSAFMANIAAPIHVVASLRLADWFENDDGGTAAETPFMMAHGTGFWGVVGRDAEFAADFYASMRADSRFVAQIIVRECGEVFAGVNSLVDVGGGDGTMAKAIAKAFPHVRCSVLDLPQVVGGNGMQREGEGTIEFIAGDMMVFIPPADAVLLKLIFHDWGDEDCVRILKRCKEAISTREPKGKVIIVDTVIGSASKPIFEEAQLLMDLNMMVLVPGKERDEEKWSKMFMDAGFTKYKISPILEPRSVIEGRARNKLSPRLKLVTSSISRYAGSILVFLEVVDFIHRDLDEESLNRHRKAYILWLFGITFDKDVVAKHLIQFAQKIVDADVDSVPRYNWGSTVLSEIYHAVTP